MSDTPLTPEEWREAVSLAYGALAFEHARILGFVEGGATVNIGRCVTVLSEGAQRGYAPNERDGIRAILAEGDFDEADAERILRVVREAAALAGENLAGVVAFLDATKGRDA